MGDKLGYFSRRSLAKPRENPKGQRNEEASWLETSISDCQPPVKLHQHTHVPNPLISTILYDK